MPDVLLAAVCLRVLVENQLVHAFGFHSYILYIVAYLKKEIFASQSEFSTKIRRKVWYPIAVKSATRKRRFSVVIKQIVDSPKNTPQFGDYN